MPQCPHCPWAGRGASWWIHCGIGHPARLCDCSICPSFFSEVRNHQKLTWTGILWWWWWFGWIWHTWLFWLASWSPGGTRGARCLRKSARPPAHPTSNAPPVRENRRLRFVPTSGNPNTASRGVSHLHKAISDAWMLAFRRHATIDNAGKIENYDFAKNAHLIFLSVSLSLYQSLFIST